MVGKEKLTSDVIQINYIKGGLRGGGEEVTKLSRRQALTTGHTCSRSNPGWASLSHQLCALEQLTVSSNGQYIALHVIGLKTQLNLP